MPDPSTPKTKRESPSVPPAPNKVKQLIAEEIEDADFLSYDAMTGEQPNPSPPLFEIDESVGIRFNLDYIPDPVNYALVHLGFADEDKLPAEGTRIVGMGIYPGLNWNTNADEDWVVLISNVTNDIGQTIAYKMYNKTATDKAKAASPFGKKVQRKLYRKV